MTIHDMLRDCRLYGAYSPNQWLQVGRRVKQQLPEHEFQPFITWLDHNEPMLQLYVRFPGEAVRKWHDSVERYLLDDPTEVSEGL